jgi:hypothetical protein
LAALLAASLSGPARESFSLLSKSVGESVGDGLEKELNQE